MVHEFRVVRSDCHGVYSWGKGVSAVSNTKETTHTALPRVQMDGFEVLCSRNNRDFGVALSQDVDVVSSSQ